MSNPRKRADTGALPLLELIRQAEALRHGPGVEGRHADLEERIRRSLVEGLRRCPLSRWEVAGQVSAQLGREVSKYMLDKYVSETAPHHIAPSTLAVLCRVIEWHEPLQLQAEAAGLFCVPGPDALRADVQRLAEQEREIRAKKRQLEVFLREMEDG